MSPPPRPDFASVSLDDTPRVSHWPDDEVTQPCTPVKTSTGVEMVPAHVLGPAATVSLSDAERRAIAARRLQRELAGSDPFIGGVLAVGEGGVRVSQERTAKPDVGNAMANMLRVYGYEQHAEPRPSWLTRLRLWLAQLVLPVSHRIAPMHTRDAPLDAEIVLPGAEAWAERRVIAAAVTEYELERVWDLSGDSADLRAWRAAGSELERATGELIRARTTNR